MKNTRIFIVILGVILISSFAAFAETHPAETQPEPAKPAETQPKPELKTSVERLSYTIGVQIAQSIRADDIELNLKVLIRALEDVFQERPLAMTEEEMRETVMKFQQELMAKQQQAMKELAGKNLKAAQEFLEENRKRDEVTELPSGVQYRVIRKGDGPIPQAEDMVRVHYRGRLLDGTVFDSSYEREEPAVFPVGGVIPGMAEALQIMPVGSHWELFIPPGPAYGEMGRPGIPPNSLLIFELELIEIVKNDTTTE